MLYQHHHIPPFRGPRWWTGLSSSINSSRGCQPLPRTRSPNKQPPANSEGDGPLETSGRRSFMSFSTLLRQTRLTSNISHFDLDVGRCSEKPTLVSRMREHRTPRIFTTRPVHGPNPLCDAFCFAESRMSRWAERHFVPFHAPCHCGLETVGRHGRGKKQMSTVVSHMHMLSLQLQQNRSH